METAIKYIGLILLMALLFICCITNDAIINGIVNAKRIWFLLICGLAIIYLAVIKLKYDVPVRLNSLDVAVIVFLLYFIANNTLHDGQLLSRKNMENAGLIGTYFFTKRLFISKQFPYSSFLVLILVLVLSQIVIAVLQWFEYLPSYNSNFKFSGIFFNPAPFIIFLSAILIYCLTAWLYSTNKIIKITGLCLFIIALPIVAIAFSRSAWLGLLAGTLLVFSIKFEWLKKAAPYLKRTSIKLISLSLLILVGLFIAYNLYHLKKESADGRLLVWKLCLNIISDHPLNGIGQENFAARIIEYQSAYFRLHPDRMLTEGRLADTVYYAFNDLLQITVEQGLIGLILFVAILITLFKPIRQITSNTDPIKLPYIHAVTVSAIGALMVILVSGLTSYPLVMLPIAAVFFCSMGIISAGYSSGLGIINVYKPINKISYAIGGLIIGICLTVYSLILCRTYYLGNNIAKDGYDKTNKQISELTQYSLLVNTEEWYVLRQCDYLLHIGQYKRATVELEKVKAFTAAKALYFSLADLYVYQKQYVKAEENLKFMYYALPGLVAPKCRLAKFYYDTKQQAKWNKAAAEVLKFQPKIHSPIADEMVGEIRQLYLAHN